MDPSTQRRVSAVLALGGLVGATLGAARGGVVWAMDRLVRGLDPRMTEWRVAERLPVATLLGLAVGLGVAWLLDRALARPARRGSGVVLATLAGAALFLAVLAGFPYDDPYHVPDPRSARGAQSLGALALAALALAGLTALVLARARAGRGLARGLGRPAAAVLALALCALVPVGWRLAHGRVSETLVVREVVRELLLEPDALVTLEARGDAPPAIAPLTPDLDFRLDAGEMPALVMPPPCSVAFEVRPEDGPVRLLAAAGADRGLQARFPAGATRPIVRFTIAVNDVRVFTVERAPGADEEPAARAWARAGGAEGLALAPGDRVRLATELAGVVDGAGGGHRAGDADRAGDESGAGADGARDARPRGGTRDAGGARDPGRAGAELEAPLAAPLAVGFGGLELERRVERARRTAASPGPNLVLVVMDTLRADRTSLHGYARETTPRLDALAERGLVFERAYASSSWTWPATASLLTGLPNDAHGVASADACWLASGLDTLAEALARAGYTTAAFTANPLVVPGKNFDQGFETFDYSPRDFLMSDVVMPNVLAWLEAHAHLRFFLYVHLVDPHEPYRPRPADRERFAGTEPADLPPGYMTHYASRLLEGEGRASDGSWDPARVVPPEHLRWISEIYDASVATGDFYTGELLDRLDALGLADDTLVAFTSDHGEELCEHGHLKHGQSLHEELVHVPLVLAGPGVEPGRVATPVENRHLAATLARAAGVPFGTAGDALDLRSGAALAPTPVFCETHSGFWDGALDVTIRGARARGLALHWAVDRAVDRAGDRAVDRAGASDDDLERALGLGRVRLFDLERDPGETTDVAGARPAEARELLELVRRRARALESAGPRTHRAGEGMLDVLRHTGYAGESEDGR